MGKVGKQNKHRKWDDFEKNRRPAIESQAKNGGKLVFFGGG